MYLTGMTEVAGSSPVKTGLSVLSSVCLCGFYSSCSCFLPPAKDMQVKQLSMVLFVVSCLMIDHFQS